MAANSHRGRTVRRCALTTGILLSMLLGCAARSTAPAEAFNPLKPVCKVAQLGSGVAGKVCGLVSAPGKLLGAGRQLITGHVGGAMHSLLGGGGAGVASSSAATAVGLSAIGAWVLGGARFALHETARVLGQTTSPRLLSAWFSSTYRRMGAIAGLLTLPFLFAAAVQALVRGDIPLLTRAAFGYLPLALLAVAIAAPLTMLLLAASDQLSAIVASAAGHESTGFLVRAGEVVGVLSFFRGSPFLAFLVGLIAAAGALVLWLELLMREAAVYIVVLMLPLAFAAMVWPARRAWAMRAIELLVALILAKFAIVAVLALGGAALGQRGGGITGALSGAVLVLLGAFAPWALLRLLPLTEIASGAAGSMRAHARVPVGLAAGDSAVLTGPAAEWAGTLSARMMRQAEEAGVQQRGDAAAGSWPDAAPLQELERVPADGAGEHAAAGGGGAPAGTEGNALPVAVSGAPSPASDGDRRRQRETSAGGGPGDTTPDAPVTPAERSPGLGAMWQAPDMSWRPLTLGIEEWPPGPLWEPPEASDVEGGSGAAHRAEHPLPAPREREDGPL